MKIYDVFFCQPFLRLSTRILPIIAILLTLVLALIPACTGKRMSLQEAKKVTVSMSGKSLVPPPRRIDDILAILEQPGQFDSTITKKFKAIADKVPPPNASKRSIVTFYYNRAKANFSLGRLRQSLSDARTALSYAEEAGIRDSEIFCQLACIEEETGNFKRVIELINRAIEINNFYSYNSYLAHMYLRAGDIDTARKIRANAIILGFSKKIGTLFARLEARYLEVQGKFAEAERYRRIVVKNWASKKERPWLITIASIQKVYLANNLKEQGRLVEAELEARQAIKELIGLGGNKSFWTAWALWSLGEIMIAQGRLQDALRLAHTRISIFEETGITSEFYKYIDAKIFLGNVLSAKYDFAGAMKQFDSAIQDLESNQYLFTRFITRNPNIILSLLKTNRPKEAKELISLANTLYSKYSEELHYESAEILALRGFYNSTVGNNKLALQNFATAIPILLEQNRGESGDYLKQQRFKIIVETYIDLLSRIYGSQLERDAGIDASAEAFMLADALCGHSVQRALGASSARAAATDPNLANLVRKEQNALKQIHALQSSLSNLLSTHLQKPSSIKGLKDSIDTLSNARAALLNEIKRRFPKYSDFTNPKPAILSSAQKHLRPTEAMIVIYPANERNFVWAISQEGKVQFAVVPVSKRDLQLSVTHLRKALDCSPATLGDIPQFDVGRAYDLYAKLLKTVENGWKDATELIIVATGPLGQLPFSVLPTKSVRLERERNELFANYRKIPWLIRKVSITRVPSVSSFISLRSLQENKHKRKAFAGFGDPLFNQGQLAQAEGEKDKRIEKLTSRGEHLHVRGIRVTKHGNLDNENISSTYIGHLNRLPDTAEEIKSIANTLGADPMEDIFLGKYASEHQVKTMDLSNRRVIAFASHALVPGDLDGLDQPAIALSSPLVTGDNEDGLLTMGEILRLKLNADWVVLSACNTGAAEGEGAEALSGLGKAFFYAGTRAILASMWPVETTSAKKLTTGVFRYQKEDKTLSRARALRESMLELINSSGLKDNATGKIVASYAHPIFWAPFIIVGEGGASF